MSRIEAEYDVREVTITLDGAEAEVLAGLLSRLASPPDTLGYLVHEMKKMFPEARGRWALVENSRGQRHVDPSLIRWPDD